MWWTLPLYDSDVPRLDRSQLRGEFPDQLLTFSSSTRKEKSKEGGVR